MSARNAARVRAMWEAFRQEGVEAFLRLVPDDVEWHPALADGKVLRGTRELREFFEQLSAGGTAWEVSVDVVDELSEDVVLLTGTITREGRSEDIVWLYAFRDGRLQRASAHRSAEEAREAARFIAPAQTRWGSSLTPLTIGESRDGERIVLLPHGELDLSTALELTGAIGRALDDCEAVVVDLSGLTFMDSSGLRCFLEADERARQRDRRLILRPGPETVQRVFTLGGVERLLNFES